MKFVGFSQGSRAWGPWARAWLDYVAFSEYTRKKNYPNYQKCRTKVEGVSRGYRVFSLHSPQIYINKPYSTIFVPKGVIAPSASHVTTNIFSF